MLTRNSQKILIAFSSLVIVLASLLPVHAVSSWSGDRPTTNFTYRSGTGGPVNISNSQSGQDRVQSALAVEVSQFSQDVGPSQPPNDQYVLRVLGAANSRIPHNYVLNGYGDDFTDCTARPCTSSGITNPDQGAWIALPDAFYFWGHPYTRIFVCSNGWAAFSYNGSESNCPYSGGLPKADYVDSNGRFQEVPEAVLAPLWKPLNPSPKSGSGQISTWAIKPNVYPGSCAYPASRCMFGVLWDNVVTSSNNDRSCLGGPCQNTFSLTIFSTGEVLFGYHATDPNDPISGVVGVDDPSGYLAMVPNRNMAVCGANPCPSGYSTSNHGVSMYDPNYSGAYLSDAKIALFKPSTSDASSAVFMTDNGYLDGYNIRTTSPPQPVTPDITPIVVTGSQVVEAAVLGLLCFGIEIGTVACFSIGAGVALIDSACGCTQSLAKALTPQPTNPPAFRNTPLYSNSQLGELETPVQEQDNLCGRGGYHGCAEDIAVFDVILWTVPHDSVSHSLHLSLLVQTSGTIDGPGTTWESTSVDLTIGPEGDFGLSSSCSSLTLLSGGFRASCPLTLTGLNDFYGTIALQWSVSPSGIGGPLPSFSGPASFDLSANGQVTTNLLIQSGSNSGSYAISVTGTSGPSPPVAGYLSLSHTVSITVNVATFKVSASPTSLSLAGGGSQSDVAITLTSSSFSGTITMSASVSPVVPSGPLAWWRDFPSSPTPGVVNVTLSSGATSIFYLTVMAGGATGSYTIAVTGTCKSGTCSSPAETHSISPPISLTVTSFSCVCGGSVAPGTLIALANGSQVPAQNLSVGMQLLSYNVTSHHYLPSTITAFYSVVTYNQMVISTSTGKPLIVDQNPAQKVYVKLLDGTVTLKSVTDLRIGYDLFDAIRETWVPITDLHYQDRGVHIMYDIYTTAPGNYIANGYLDPLKE